MFQVDERRFGRLHDLLQPQAECYDRGVVDTFRKKRLEQVVEEAGVDDSDDTAYATSR